MSNRSILHISGYDKFTKPILDTLIARGGETRHFLLLCRQEEFPLPSALNFFKPAGLLFLKVYLQVAMSVDRIILHGLFEKKVILALFLFPCFLKKTTLMVWGGDVYNIENNLSRFYRYCYRHILKRISTISTTVPGDYDFVKGKYGVNAAFVQSLMYYSHVARRPAPTASSMQTDELIVQVGNSADPLNCHLEIFDRLPPDTSVFAPLAYGDKNYGKMVVQEGRARFGERFDAMTGFIAFDDYTAKLNNVSVAIFNHPRQAAMGNCIAFLSLGKRLYIRSDTTPWSYFRELGFYVFDTLGELELSPLPTAMSQHNILLARQVFSEEALLNSWDTLIGQECCS